MSKNDYEIRCPIHGLIPMNLWERRLIDHPVFQRLRRIRQLAWTDHIYEFSLYSYGPFDSSVLADLQSAESMSVINSDMITFSGGYQYQLSTSGNAPVVKRYSKKFLDKNREAINWVVKNFASRSASELELLSTIVYVDQEGRSLSLGALRDRVKHIKPHFSAAHIELNAKLLISQGILKNVA